MAKSKTNKNRNVGFVYEALAREIARASIGGDKTKQDSGIYAAKVFFAEGTNLRKVLDLYQALLETKGASEPDARRTLAEVYKVYANFVDQADLEREQDEMLDYINSNFDKKSMFMNFIPNYKTLATIDQLFGNKLKVKSRITLENNLISTMTATADEKEEQKMEPMDALALGIYVNSFNEKFSEKLLPEQRQLLGRYITTIADNGTSFKIFVSDELGRLKEGIERAKTLPDVKSDASMASALEKIDKLCDKYARQPLNEDMIAEIMHLQGLVHEVNLDDSKSKD